MSAEKYEASECIATYTVLYADVDFVFYEEYTSNECTGEFLGLRTASGWTDTLEVNRTRNATSVHLVANLEVRDELGEVVDTLTIDGTWDQSGRGERVRSMYTQHLPGDHLYQWRTRGVFAPATVTGIEPFDTGTIGTFTSVDLRVTH